MIIIQCYDLTFTIKGITVEEARPSLSRRGLEIVGRPTDPQITSAFFFEKTSRHYDLHQGETLVAKEQALPVLMELVAQRILVLVGLNSPGLTFLQGDAVKDKNGRAIVLVGSGFSGKTRLAQALIDKGASPHSESFVAFNDQGKVAPFPRGSFPGEEDFTAVGALAMLNHRPGSAQRIEEMTAGQASAFMTQLLLDDRENMGVAMKRLAAASQSADYLCRGTRGDDQSAAEIILSHTP